MCFSEWRKKPQVIIETNRRREETTVAKYGVKNVAMAQSSIEKAKKTCLEKYGCISPTLNVDIRKKQIVTCVEKYGEDNPQKNKDVQFRQRQTLLKNFGVIVPLKSKVILDRMQKTNLAKFGVDNPLKSKKIQKRIKKTNFKKYGTTVPIRNADVKIRQKATLSQTYYFQIKKRLEEKGIVPLFKVEEYTNMVGYKEYTFQCEKCKNKFQDCLNHGHVPRCTTCYPTNNNSLLEREVKEFLETIVGKDDIEEKNRTILSGLELDFLIKSKNIAIEVNGNYWHSELNGKKYKNYHINKTQRCEKLGIHLLHIFEDEWINKRNIIEDRIRRIVGYATSENIYARQCDIKLITSKESNAFLEKTHLQGGDKSSIRYGAYYENSLIGVITFGKPRIALGNKFYSKDEYELCRFCTTGTVVGLLSRFVSRFISDHSPQKITTYADRRFSTKSKCAYSRVGFVFDKETQPNYWYLNKRYSIREHRFKYRKSELKRILGSFDSTLTEWENMKTAGFDRIWDCGNLKYVWNT